MAQIYGTSLTLTDTATTGQGGSGFDGIYNGDTATINGVTYLYTPDLIADRIYIHTVGADGSLTFVTEIADTPLLSFNGAAKAITFQSGGVDLLAVSGLSDDGVSIFTITDTAPYVNLVNVVNDSDDPDYELNGAWNMAVYETAAATFLYVAGSVDSGLSAFQISSSGLATNVDNVVSASGADIYLTTARISPSFEINGVPYLVGSGVASSGFTVFQISPTTGALTARAGISDLVGLDGAYRTSGVEIDGKGYIYIPSDGNATVSVYAFNPATNGLELVQSIQSSGSLDRAAEGSFIQLGDTLVYAVAAFDSDQFHLYSVETSGASGNAGELTLLQTLADDTGVGELNFPRMGVPFEIDGKTFLPVGALNGGAINIYEVGGGDDVLSGTQSDDEIFGGSGDDVISGLAGDDEIHGDSGTDIINAGSGIDLVYGSIGNDSTNGGSGYDTFDMRVFNGETNGVTVDMFNQKVVLPGGSVQFATGFERIFGTDQDDTLVGNEDNNDLRGEAGADVLRGREGNDFLRGGNGADQLVGGDGNDVLLGQGGDDANMNGGNGDDTLEGSTGNDGLFGGFGDDELSGGSDNDSLRGNEGADTLEGDNGDDDLRGGSGNDDLEGGLGDDFLFGDDGNDELNGEEGSNTFTGGSGADEFYFAAIATDGYNTIKDYTDGTDMIGFNGFGTEAQILAGASQKSWGVRIDLSNGETLALEGASLSSLGTEDIFLFG